MPQFDFVVSKPDRTLHLQLTELCADDAQAMGIARKIVFNNGAEQYRLEIWRSDFCIYSGSPARWPFRRAMTPKSDPLRVVAANKAV